jgi:signal transduction histidine kinase/CheY-like chemotaxis protein
MEFRELDADVTGLTRAELIEHASALRTVLRVADAVHLSSDFTILAERAVEAIVRYTAYGSVGLYCLNSAGDKLLLAAARGFAEETVRTARELSVQGSLNGIAVMRRAVVCASDLSRDLRIDPATQEALGLEGFVDAACVPVFFHDTVIGTLSILHKRTRPLADHERIVLLSIGRTLGVAMQNRIDNDQRRALEERLQRTQQLESLGVLAGGIAHDFNNLLTGITGNISLSLCVSPAEAAPLLAEAERAAQRAGELARQLASLARGGAPLKRRTSDLMSIVRDAAEFAVRGSDVRCELSAGEPIGPVLIDPSQLAQIVQNLVLNAAQASRAAGTVRVVLGSRETLGQSVIHLEVTDEGAGIAPEHLTRIFDPYFTTREHGSGLGLAVTHAAVARHGGRIDVQSRRGKGTTFAVELPLERAAAEAEPTASHGARLPQRVLLLDDEAQIRALGRNLLTHLTIEAAVAERADEAVTLFAAALTAGRPFDGVILDMTLVGGDDGAATLGRLRALDPKIRAIVSTGYSEDDCLARFEDYGFSAALPKPYTLPQLAAALKRLVSAATPAEPRTSTLGKPSASESASRNG